MSSKPKAKNYQASAAEKASASVAKAEYDYFKQKYDPLLQQMRDKAQNEDLSKGLRGRANADTMQALSKSNFQNVSNLSSPSDIGNALVGQYGIANKSANQVKNAMATNVLGTARGQAADAQTGLAQVSRLSTSEALNRAKNNQMVADAKLNAATSMALAAGLQGYENKQSSGTVTSPTGQTQTFNGSFFNPVDDKGNKIKGFGARLGYTNFLG